MRRSITFDPVVNTVDPLLASKIVWLDCLLTNMDRTSRNTNMLIWNKELWLIDHGASLYFHHTWQNWQEQALKPFTLVRDHVMLPYATEIKAVDQEFRKILSTERIRDIVSLIPDEWLADESTFKSLDEYRQAYAGFLEQRVIHSEIFVKEAQHAGKALV
jgi:hypothetical protein